MVELHSNFTLQGQLYQIRRRLSNESSSYTRRSKSQPALATGQRWASTSSPAPQSGHGVQWVGDHIRPRVRVPDSWDWPVGVSLSTEIGYQRAVYSPDTWTWRFGRSWTSQSAAGTSRVNPALERTLHGPGVAQGWLRASREDQLRLHEVVSGRPRILCGSYGRFGETSTATHDQQQQIFRRHRPERLTQMGDQLSVSAFGQPQPPTI